jgi:hypothetical protein
MDEKNKDVLTHRPDQMTDTQQQVEITEVVSSLP